MSSSNNNNSNSGSSNGGGRKRRVNPALLLGGSGSGERSEPVAGAGDFGEGAKRVDRGIGLWAGRDAGETGGGDAGGERGSGQLNAPGLPGETGSGVNGFKVPDVPGGSGNVSGRAADVLKNLQQFKDKKPSAGVPSGSGEPAVPERPSGLVRDAGGGVVDATGENVGGGSAGANPTRGVPGGKPAGRGFMLPGEKRPVRSGKAGGEAGTGSGAGSGGEGERQGGPSAGAGGSAGAGSGDRVGKSAGRGFLLDTDRIPAKRPVHFGENKEQVASEGEGAGSDVGVKNPSGRKLVRGDEGFIPGGQVRKREKLSAYVSKPEAGVDAGEWSEDDEGTSAGLGGEVDDTYVKPQYEKGFHLTERDVLMMRFLARYRYAYVDQLARLVNSIPRNVVNRLRTLEKRGFLRREAITDRQYLWTVRKAGLVLVDSDFREIKKGSISYATIAHTIGLANLGAEFEREAGGKNLLGEPFEGEEWVYPARRWKMGIRGHEDGLFPGEMTVTEREIRQAQMRWRGNMSYKELRGLVDKAVANPAGPELEEGMEGLFVVYGAGGKGGEHVPDLVVTRERAADGSPQHIAVELELTPKTPTEWRKILRNYRDNGLMFSKVYYFTHKKSIGSALLRLAADEGFADKFVVRKYIPQSGSRMPFWG